MTDTFQQSASITAGRLEKVEQGISATNEYLVKMEMRLDKRFNTVDDNVTRSKDEVLISNDKLARKLDLIITEQAAGTAIYRYLDERVSYLETVIKVLAEKVGMTLTPVSH